jgi:hypothetical protein
MTAESSKGTGMNDVLAVEIYKCKPAFNAPSSSVARHKSLGRRARGLSSIVSAQFGVSPKTVRDIWNHKTWVQATNYLWEQSVNERHAINENPWLVSNAEYSKNSLYEV